MPSDPHFAGWCPPSRPSQVPPPLAELWRVTRGRNTRRACLHAHPIGVELRIVTEDGALTFSQAGRSASAVRAVATAHLERHLAGRWILATPAPGGRILSEDFATATATPPVGSPPRVARPEPPSMFTPRTLPPRRVAELWRLRVEEQTVVGELWTHPHGCDVRTWWDGREGAGRVHATLEEAAQEAEDALERMEGYERERMSSRRLSGR